MIDFENFMMALKSSWIKRLILLKLTNLFKPYFGNHMQTLMKSGIDFAKIIIKNSNNRFGEDVFHC